MVMSTQILAEAGRLLEQTVMIDLVQLYAVGEPVTVGFKVTRELTAVGEPVPGLVQATVLANAVESRIETTYAVKVPTRAGMQKGMVAMAVRCVAQPELVGLKLLIDKVSENGLAMITKGVASRFDNVNQEGKL